MSNIDNEIAELRARLAELEARRSAEAGQASPSPPPVSPPTSPEPQKPNRAALAVAGVVGVILLIVVARSCDPGKPAATSQTSPATAPATPAAPTAPATPAPPPEPTYAWSYDEDADAMSDRKTLFACVNSTDKVWLDPPYEPVTARLCVRNSPKFGVDVFYSLNGDGQILCDSYDGCSIKVRYGDTPAGRNGATTAADHSSNIIFLSGPRAVAARMAKAKTTKIELTFYQAGDQAVSFPTEGLDLSKVGLAKAAQKSD